MSAIFCVESSSVGWSGFRPYTTRLPIVSQNSTGKQGCHLHRNVDINLVTLDIIPDSNQKKFDLLDRHP